jgi:ENTS family enterobactin (siderophore) exporter
VERPIAAMTNGLRFVAGNRVVGGLMLLGLLVMLVGGVPVLMPAFAEHQLHGGATTIGLLYSAQPTGAVLASLTSGGAVLASLTSGCVCHLHSPGRALLLMTIVSYAAAAAPAWPATPRSQSPSW